MTGQWDDIDHREYRDFSGASERRDAPFEYPALEEVPGYWAGRWAEFKRLWLQSWYQTGTRETLALSAALIIIGIIMGLIDTFS